VHKYNKIRYNIMYYYECSLLVLGTIIVDEIITDMPR